MQPVEQPGMGSIVYHASSDEQQDPADARGRDAGGQAKSTAQFTDVDVAFLSWAEDLHIAVVAGDRTIPTFTRQVNSNINVALLSQIVTVLLPSWKALRPDGTCFENEGIEPDVEVGATPEQLAISDPVLEAALAWLRPNER